MADATIKGLPPPPKAFNGAGKKVLIVHARWNAVVISSLVEGCRGKLAELGVRAEDVHVETVPGSYELPFACQKLIKTGKFDAVIAIGVLIKGSTMHFEYIADAVSHALMRVQLDEGVPVIFGVLTCLTDDQALDRAGLGRGANGKGHNHGEDWGLAAVELACQSEDWPKKY